ISFAMAGSTPKAPAGGIWCMAACAWARVSDELERERAESASCTPGDRLAEEEDWSCPPRTTAIRRRRAPCVSSADRFAEDAGAGARTRLADHSLVVANG